MIVNAETRNELDKLSRRRLTKREISKLLNDKTEESVYDEIEGLKKRVNKDVIMIITLEKALAQWKVEDWVF